MKLRRVAAIANEYCIIGFNGQELIVVDLDVLGKPVAGAAFSVSDIKNIKVSNWFFGIGRNIKITLKDNSNIKVSVNKHTIGLKNQKSNLMDLEKLFSNIA